MTPPRPDPQPGGPHRGDPGPRPDTIVAEATAPGVGGIAVVRLSGPEARAVLGRLLSSGAAASEVASPAAATGSARDAPGPGDVGADTAIPPESVPGPRRPTLRALFHPETGELLDRGLVTLFPGPESYTGEEVVELSVHGGWVVPALVVEACRAAGARLAEPGEFTRRAYLNGKLDLVQAEAVADLVEGRSRALHRAAVHQLERGLSARIADARERLVGLEALLVHHLDFPDEDEPPVSREEVAAEADGVAESLDLLLATAPEGELLREGALTVLAGRPNTGKSSLFNALIGRERAIVTETPGTTRDALDATVSLGGFPFRLVDTAGLRETSEEVEGKGIEVARRYLAGADVVLLCAEAGRALGEDEHAFLEACEGTVVLVRTRADEVEEGRRPTRPPPPPGWGADGGDTMAGGDHAPAAGPVAGPIAVSVVTGEGLARLRDLLPGLVYRGLVEAGASAPVLTRERHARGIRTALKEVRRFGEALRAGVPAEMAATHLRPAETALEEVLGVVDREDILDAVFARFCIGK